VSPRKGAFSLSVPVDVTSVGSDGGSQDLRVAINKHDGSVTSRTATLRAGHQDSVG
jgi:hypothetical protein